MVYRASAATGKITVIAGAGYNDISGKYSTVIYYYGSTSDGERLWLISDGMSNDISNGNTLSGKMYEAVGGDFDHPEPSSSSLRVMEWRKSATVEGLRRR